MSNHRYILIVFVLAIVSALGQLSTNIYAPLMVEMSEALKASSAEIQLSVTVFLVTFALSQLVAGPLSDAISRTSVLLAALVLFVAGSIIPIFGDGLNSLFVGRTFQGLGAGAGVVLARAAAADLFKGTRLQQALGLLNAIFVTVPAVSPILGVLTGNAWGWKYTFALAAVISIASAVGFFAIIPEVKREKVSMRNALEQVSTSEVFWKYGISAGLLYAVLFAFVSKSPFILIDGFNFSNAEHASILAGGSLCLIIGSLLFGFIKAPARKTYPILLLLAAIGSAAIYSSAIAGLALAFVAAFYFYLIILGGVMPVAISLVLGAFPSGTGTASSLLGFGHMTLAAGATFVAATIGGSQLTGLAVTAVGCSLAALCLHFLPRSRADRQERA